MAEGDFPLAVVAARHAYPVKGKMTLNLDLYQRTASPPTTRVRLLSRLRRRDDEEAWNQFCTLYVPVILSYCRRKGLQEADAWDVTQAVLTNISRWIGSFEYDRSRGRFRNWLGVVTRREIQRLRDKAARPGAGVGGGCQDRVLDDLSGSADPDWSEACNSHIFRCGLERSRQHFDDATWSAFTRTWLQHETPKDVAQQLGRTIAWVYQARYRVLRRMQSEVASLSDDGISAAS